MNGYVSEAVIRRLPGYYRHLKELEREGVEQISSQELGARMRLTASQIRQDINCFGGYGRQGYGYSVSGLREHIGNILGLGSEHNMIIIGAGNIGRAVVLSDSFGTHGFNTVAIFDREPRKTGMLISSLSVQDMSGLKRCIDENPIDIAVIAVPAESAQAVADELCGYGIKGFWNFAPVDLKLPEDATVVNVHLNESLEILSFRMAQRQNGAQ